ncbi:MAG TPA: DUF1858 domain-containing protein [Bacilli bacterium]|nr:DUF1858 domain-containing protein [Bacilli bacterium]
MQIKTININESVHEVVSKDERVKTLLFELGFKEIIKPAMLQTVGKIMTIKKGAAMRGINLDVVKQKFEENGFEVVEESYE